MYWDQARGLGAEPPASCGPGGLRCRAQRVHRGNAMGPEASVKYGRK